jgi:hypothetical protein
VTGVGQRNIEQYESQIAKLVSSSLLHGSEALCKLLRYLADQSIHHPASPIKEYQIATEVFGRPADFDPRLDSTVRVQTGRLRSKLSEYYAGPGASDSTIIEIPKGSYMLTFRRRSPNETSQERPAAISPVEVKSTQAYPNLLWAVVALSVLLGLTVSWLAYYLWQDSVTHARSRTLSSQRLASLESFWLPFISGPNQPLAVFSNAEFVGRPETGMRYWRAGDSREQILDHHTGVGEVIAVHELDRIFNLLNHGFRVKRGQLLSFDDVKNSDVIFIGSPSENLSLRDIPNTQDFVFRVSDAPGRIGDLAIYNLKPASSEQKVFFASNRGQTLTEDYAVIGMLPGLRANRTVLIGAGITTLGTQAAIEYVCRPEGVEELLSRLTGSKTGRPRAFEAVLQVRVSKGVPVESRIVAFHAKE